MRKFIFPIIVIYIIHVKFITQENSWKLFILYVCWEKKSQEKLSFLYRALSFSWFYDEIHVVR